ncbi:unnamed protein product [Didymodactylos carnosus]|uniref:Uncharacterized protein n=1 Tax=Didymodactylos carnosus TaxID=1234261 RepID=A0A813SLY4_9BILA|nr:unnamed protein product [Didymodactylos carnosus]CAF1542484.1 unnamed protein product [Didymodactylos carnosus]CAF3583742.1 unnamed protein product [Didymodactylos carnosus]CAF4331063.1 unnamed protein product [Didymodactylos carnosus]
MNCYLILLIIVLQSFKHSLSIQCWECTDCPEPFYTSYPYAARINNTNYGAVCMKTVMTLDTTKLINKGSLFQCPATTSTANIQIYCCGQDFCNQGDKISTFANSILLSLIIVTLSFYGI